MGWTHTHKPAGQKVVDFLADELFRNQGVIVAKGATRQAAFFVIKSVTYPVDNGIYVPDPDGTVRVIVVVKYQAGWADGYGHNFGWKTMEESMGPIGCEAPKTIVDAASELLPDNGRDGPLSWAHEYRKRSLEASERR